MPDITVRLTDEQFDALNLAREAANAIRAAQDPPLPPLSEGDWAKSELEKDIQQASAEAEAFDINRLARAYQVATPAERQAARQAVKVPTVPVPPR